jgi:hypothetical protein
VHELFVRFDLEDSTLVAARLQPNEDAWPLARR